MEHFNDSLKVPFFDATTKKFNPSTPKSKWADIGFSLRGLLLVKTKNVVPP